MIYVPRTNVSGTGRSPHSAAQAYYRSGTLSRATVKHLRLKNAGTENIEYHLESRR